MSLDTLQGCRACGLSTGGFSCRELRQGVPLRASKARSYWLPCPAFRLWQEPGRGLARRLGVEVRGLAPRVQRGASTSVVKRAAPGWRKEWDEMR